MSTQPNVIANTDAMLAQVKQAIEAAKSKGLNLIEIDMRFQANVDRIPDEGPKFYLTDTRVKVRA